MTRSSIHNLLITYKTHIFKISKELNTQNFYENIEEMLPGNSSNIFCSLEYVRIIYYFICREINKHNCGVIFHLCLRCGKLWYFSGNTAVCRCMSWFVKWVFFYDYLCFQLSFTWTYYQNLSHNICLVLKIIF